MLVFSNEIFVLSFFSKNFKNIIKGYENKDDISDDNRILLGNYRYDNNSKYNLQFFQVQVSQNKFIFKIFVDALIYLNIFKKIKQKA